MNNLEILAPAGNMSSLMTAIANGANAVYLGLDKFSARAKAENFSLDNFDKTAEYCHLFGVRVYVTINTLIKDSEMDEAVRAAVEVWNKGADALIVQDLGLIHELRTKHHEIVLHASTQMGIHDMYGAKIAEKMGFKRVVLSRETLLSDIKAIRDNTNLEIEAFVQGALCVSFSGNCYLSSFVSGYSGNRGRCLQLCRKEYTLCEGQRSEKAYWLSTKDMMLAHSIKDLIDAGVTSFKIEGRLRRPEYVGGAVAAYIKAINGSFDENDLINLKCLYNRGDYTESHLKVPCESTIYKQTQNNIGLYIGKVEACDDKFLQLPRKVNKGDGLKFLHNGKEVGGAVVGREGKETTYVGKVSIGDDVRLTTCFNLNEQIMRAKRSIPLKIFAEYRVGKYPLLKLSSGDSEITVRGDHLIETAKSAPTGESDLITNLSKVGDSDFRIDDIKVLCDKNIFVPKSIINELRRKGLTEIKKTILQNYENKRQIASKKSLFISDINSNYITYDQRTTFCQMGEDGESIPHCDYLIINPSVYSIEKLEKFRTYGDTKVLLSLPIVARGIDNDILRQIIKSNIFYGYVINNLGQIDMTVGKRILMGYAMNLLNSYLDVPRISSIETDSFIKDTVIYTYGKPALMTFCHCPNKTFGNNCNKCTGYNYKLIDDKGAEYKLQRYKIFYCYSQLFANKPINIVANSNAKLIDIGVRDESDFSTFNYRRGLM